MSSQCWHRSRRRCLAVRLFSVLANRRYLGYVGASAFIAAAMFGYVAASPFVLQDIVGLSPATYSYTFASFSVALAVGSVVARTTVGSVAPRQVMAGGVVALMAITAVLLVTVTVGGVRPWPTIALMGCFMAGIGFQYGPAAMLATTEVRHAAGTGSAIYGFAQYSAGAVVSPLVGVAGHSSAVPMGVVMFASILAAAATLFLLTRGSGGDLDH
jgi:DHA1 family bicyclomycin/chloramphenicol resistance-like MFS transporter